MLPLHLRSFFVSALLVCLSLLSSSYGQTYSILERVCCCENATEACCPVNFFDVQTDQSIGTGLIPDQVVTPYYGNFSAVNVDENYIKNNLNIFAPEDVDCADALALLLPTEEGRIVPIAQVELEQIGPAVCLVNFSSVAKADRLREEVDLVIGFREGFVLSGTEIDVSLVLRESIVGFTLPQHSFVATADPNDSTRLDLTLSVLISPNSKHNDTCFAPDNLDQLAFQLGDPADPSYPRPECLFPATNKIQSDNRPTFRIDALGIEQSQYLNQCYDSIEVTEDNVIFTYQVREAFGNNCEYVVEFPEYYNPFFFTVSISTRIMATNDGGTLANTVEVDYRDDTLQLIPCAVDDEGFDQDVSSLIPMGRLRFNVDVKTSYDFVPIGIVLEELRIGDVDLRVVDGPIFSAVNGTNTGRLTVETTECLWVITQHSEQPATQENLIGCSIDYLSQMTIVANVTFADTFIQDNELLGQERSIVYQSNNASDCPVQAISTDVTAAYNADLIIQDPFGNSENLNLDTPIVSRLGLDATLMQAFDGLNVVMDQVIVTLTSDELTAADGEFVRMFSPNDKRNQMQFDFHPYYSDGHFCRSYIPAPDNSSAATCQRFYSEGTLGQWNPFLAESLSTDFFVEDADGQPRVSFCQDRTDLKEDRFIFTPNNWIFGQFPYTSGTMSITATAFVRNCIVVGDNGELPTRRRALQQYWHGRGLQEGDGTGSTIIFQNVTFVNSPLTINQGNNVVDPNTALIRDLIIGFSTVIAVFICIIISAIVWFCRYRSRTRLAQ